jgi:hypothetical protein
MGTKFDWIEYDKLVMNAKNKGIEFGLYSKEYANAVKEMNNFWMYKKQNWIEKLINKINKIVWQLTTKR